MAKRLSLAKPPTSYAEMTHGSPFWVVRYPHRRRLALAIELILREHPRTLVDYGAGDGEMVAMMVESGLGAGLEKIILFDPVPEMVELTRARLEPLLGERLTVCGAREEVIDALQGERADVISCLEVLEHLWLAERRRFYSFCTEHLKPSGRAVIDVPVEIGPALLIKQAGRRLLKGRPRQHQRGELMPKLLGRRTVDPERFDPDHQSGWIDDHTGFDHRVFKNELTAELEVTETRVSPFGGPAWINQEIFFVAKPSRTAG